MPGYRRTRATTPMLVDVLGAVSLSFVALLVLVVRGERSFLAWAVLAGAVYDWWMVAVRALRERKGDPNRSRPPTG